MTNDSVAKTKIPPQKNFEKNEYLQDKQKHKYLESCVNKLGYTQENC